jgi:hypothetical protein
MKHTLVFGMITALAALMLVWGSVAHEGGPTVDGIIADEEYESHYTDETLNMTLHWTVDTEEGLIYAGLEAPTQGWVGIGFDFEGADMESMSMDWIIGAFHDADGETDVLDAFQENADAVAQADTFLGGDDDILEKAAVQTEDGTTFEFTRKLDTGDEFDVALQPGSQGTMLATGDEDEYEHFDEESVTMVMIDFFAGTVGMGEGK